MRLSLSKVVLLAAALALVPGTARADTLTPAGFPCTTNYIVYPAFSPMFTSCLGAFVGNNTGNQATRDLVVAEMISAGWGSGWIDETQNALAAPGPFVSVPGTGSGYLQFMTPQFASFVIALKTRNFFSLYLFTPPSAGWGSGGLLGVDFTTAGVAPLASGNLAALSHATLYSAVPEPSTVILLGTGLLGLFGVEYRRRKKA